MGNITVNQWLPTMVIYQKFTKNTDVDIFLYHPDTFLVW